MQINNITDTVSHYSNKCHEYGERLGRKFYPK